MSNNPVEYGAWRWEPWQTVSIRDTGGPSRTVYDQPAPDDWTPPRPVGFAPPGRHRGTPSAQEISKTPCICLRGTCPTHMPRHYATQARHRR